MRPSYVARARRVGQWWAIDVPKLRGVHTQTRRLDEAGLMARDAIAAMLDLAGDSFDVQVEAVLEPGMHDVVTLARRLRSEAERVQSQAAAEMTRAAAELVQQGLTVRDAGALLGVSHQRIAQLVGDRSGTT
jgi:predicted RNase H-like HicB family nuclease